MNESLSTPNIEIKFNINFRDQLYGTNKILMFTHII
jgi:hypothetical protein